MEITPSGGSFVFERSYPTPDAPVFEKGIKPFFPQKVTVRWYEYLLESGRSYGGHSVKLEGPIQLAAGGRGTRESDFTFGHEDIAHVFQWLPDWLEPIYAKARAEYEQQRSSLYVAVGCAAELRMLDDRENTSFTYANIGARKVVEAILLSLRGPHDAYDITAEAEDLIEAAIKKIRAAEAEEE